jgi:hypothetical protein
LREGGARIEWKEPLRLWLGCVRGGADDTVNHVTATKGYVEPTRKKSF